MARSNRQEVGGNFSGCWAGMLHGNRVHALAENAWSGYSTTMSMLRSPRTASMADEPVSPEVPTRSVRRRVRRVNRWLSVFPSTDMPRSLKANVGPCHSSATCIGDDREDGSGFVSTTLSLPNASNADETRASISACEMSTSLSGTNNLSSSAQSCEYDSFAQDVRMPRLSFGTCVGHNMPPSSAQPARTASPKE